MSPQLSEAIARLDRLAAEQNKTSADLLNELLEPLDDDLAGETELWAMVAESDAEPESELIPHEEVMREMQAVIEARRLARGA